MRCDFVVEDLAERIGDEARVWRSGEQPSILRPELAGSISAAVDHVSDVVSRDALRDLPAIEVVQRYHAGFDDDALCVALVKTVAAGAHFCAGC